MKYSIAQLAYEVARELKMRKNVWKHVKQGKGVFFIDTKHQAYYNVLKEVHDLLKYAPEKELQRVRELAESAKRTVQISIEFEKENEVI